MSARSRPKGRTRYQNGVRKFGVTVPPAPSAKAICCQRSGSRMSVTVLTGV